MPEKVTDLLGNLLPVNHFFVIGSIGASNVQSLQAVGQDADPLPEMAQRRLRPGTVGIKKSGREPTSPATILQVKVTLLASLGNRVELPRAGQDTIPFLCERDIPT